MVEEKTESTKPKVPYGVAVDEGPPAKPARAATNDPADRRKALILIGVILASVLLLVILGNTVLRPAIVAQRERMLIRITQEQADEFAALAAEFHQRTGSIPTEYADLAENERLETSAGIDLWGNRYVFSTSDAATEPHLITVRSAGPDGEYETADDIVAERLLGDVEED